MPGQRIKFRGAYEPHVIGANRPHDSLPWSRGRKPRYQEILVNGDASRQCVNCGRVIAEGSRYYQKSRDVAIHELC